MAPVNTEMRKKSFGNIALKLAVFTAVAVALSACSQPSAESETLESDSTSAKLSNRENPAVSQGVDGEIIHENRLVNETSPYLLQHAHNPVDWWPWSEEALAQSVKEDKPIFLSIGYSSCHWCHVMERESFENEAIAEIMNANFICIKVDREERPDLDEIYMAAVTAMTGSGGWPMSVFLTPDLKPFFGGTYFPPEGKYGRPGFTEVLNGVATAWKDRRSDVLANSDRLVEHITQTLAANIGEAAAVDVSLLEQATEQLSQAFDASEGGFGSAPKFPSSPSIALLLREYMRTGKQHLLDMAELTLDKMAYGGMYDQIGGGFARYSTDEQWLVPHFEKMIYDNAQLAQVYLEAYQLTKKPLYRRIAEETFNYVLRDMRDDGGGFHSAEDADSEGEEGKFYLWDYSEIMSILGDEDGAFFCEYYEVRKKGNFDSHESYHTRKNVLHMRRTEEELSQAFKMSLIDLEARISELNEKLMAVRSERVRPGLDDKVLASWNALMIAAFAQGYQVLGDERYRTAATEAADFLLTEMMEDGNLLRTHRQGESRLPAYLDDYAFFADALLDLYEATFDVKWLRASDEIAGKMIEKFWDNAGSGFYFTSDDHKNLLVRTRPTYDGAIPSGNSVAALSLLRLAKFFDNSEYYEKGRGIIESNHAYLTRAPRGYLKMLCVVDFFLNAPKEIALAGDPNGEGIQKMLRALHGQFVPNKILAFVDPSDPGATELGEEIPLLAGKKLIDGQATAYVCKDFACKLPVTTVQAFLQQLGLNGGEA